MDQNKKELAVAALENGTVIDHIPSSSLFKVVKLLGIENISSSVTIGNNLGSKKLGTKGILKLANVYFPEATLNRVALIAPNVKVNIIKDYKVDKKFQVTLPDEIHGLVRCNNPKCITNNEPMQTHFHVEDKENVLLRCHYCERTVSKDEIELI